MSGRQHIREDFRSGGVAAEGCADLCVLDHRTSLGRHFLRDANAFDAYLLRIRGVDGGLDGADMVGCGAATSSNELHPGLEKFSADAGHVFRRTGIDVASFNGAGHSGVGHGRDGQAGDGSNALDGGEDGGGADAAIAADGIRAPLFEVLGGEFRG